MSGPGRIGKEILCVLLDRYEHSRRFLGVNRNGRLPQFVMAKQFPDYADDSQYAFFRECNEAAAGLEHDGLVTVERGRGEVIRRILLRMDGIDAAYRAAGRKPRSDMQAGLRALLEKMLAENTMHPEKTAALDLYIRAQLERIAVNKNVEYFDGDLQEYMELLEMAREVLANEEECFIRDFSVRLFGDSKKAEEYRGRVESLLYAYGDYADKNTVLEEQGILRTPAYVMFKGAAKLFFETESIDLTALGGDMALSTESLKNVKRVEVYGKKLITVENLTSFHDFQDAEALIIYLGGFHNRTKRMLLQLIYSDAPGLEYLHFGDIDAGGLYILEHLRKKTGIPFEPLFMDRETLLRFRKQAKELTANDRKRLAKLRERYESGQIAELIDCMLKEGIKLEQEAVSACCGWT